MHLGFILFFVVPVVLILLGMVLVRSFDWKRVWHCVGHVFTTIGCIVLGTSLIIMMVWQIDSAVQYNEFKATKFTYGAYIAFRTDLQSLPERMHIAVGINRANAWLMKERYWNRHPALSCFVHNRVETLTPIVPVR